MKRFFRWRHWRASSKFWRKRALKAESLLEAEMWRNREREDVLVDGHMRAAGLWVMPARTGPAMKNVSRETPRQLTQPTDPWDALSWADKQEYEMFWKVDAQAAGVPEHQARQQFLAELQNRRISINDEPFS